MPVDVEVFERVDSTTAMQPFQQYAVVRLELVGNELRAWPVAPGRYEVLLVSDTASRELTLGASSSNCARWPGEGQRYVCIAGSNASVIVRNPAPAGKGHDAAGSLFISRAFDTDRDTAFARTHPGPWLRTKWAVPEKPRPGELPCVMTRTAPKRG